MPNPNFERIIGSSFDNLAGQRQYWSQFNAGIEAANMQRQAAAEQAANNYFQQQAALDEAAARSAIANDASARNSAANYNLALAQMAEDRRKNQQANVLSRDQMGLQEKYMRWQQGAQERQDAKNREDISRFGEAMAPEVIKLGNEYSKLEGEYNSSIRKANELADQIKAEKLSDLPIKWDPGTGRYIATSKFDIVPPERYPDIQAAEREVGAELARTARLQDEFKRIGTEFFNRRTLMEKNGLVVRTTPDGMWEVFDPSSQKRWGGSSRRESGSTELPDFTPRFQFSSPILDAIPTAEGKWMVPSAATTTAAVPSNAGRRWVWDSTQLNPLVPQ